MISAISVTSIEDQHWTAIKEIYEQGLATGVATFETQSPSWEQWDKAHLTICRFVAQEADVVVGWIALSPISSRCAYRGVAEVSVYVHVDHRRKGIGKRLLQKAITSSEDNGYWMLQAGIMRANVGSVKLHESVGFRIVGYRERISQINDIWIDNLLLERRSLVIGIE